MGQPVMSGGNIIIRPEEKLENIFGGVGELFGAIGKKRQENKELAEFTQLQEALKTEKEPQGRLDAILNTAFSGKIRSKEGLERLINTATIQEKAIPNVYTDNKTQFIKARLIKKDADGNVIEVNNTRYPADEINELIGTTRDLGGGVTETIERGVDPLGGSSTMAQLHMLKNRFPNVPPEQLIAFLKGNYGKGLIPVAGGTAGVVEGVPDATQKVAYSEEKGKQAAIRDTAKEIEEQKLIGKGEQTPIAKQKAGRQQVSLSVKDMRKLLVGLQKANGITSTENTRGENLKISGKASWLGQKIGVAIGTKAQSIRNRIKQFHPLFVMDIKKASDLGAKSFDTPRELEFWLQAVGNIERDVESNLAALVVLDRQFGLGLGIKETPEIKAAEYGLRQDLKDSEMPEGFDNLSEGAKRFFTEPR